MAEINEMSHEEEPLIDYVARKIADRIVKDFNSMVFVKGLFEYKLELEE